jgi:hypothetical protein
VFFVVRETYSHSFKMDTGDQPWRRGSFENKDQFYTGIEGAGSTEYVTATFVIQFPAFQDMEGRGVFQHLYFSMMASLFTGEFDVQCIGPDRGTVISSGTALPDGFTGDNLDRDLFLDFSMQPATPVYGTRVCYKVSSTEPFRVTSAVVECMVSSVQERGYRPDLIPAEIAAQDPLQDRLVWVTRGQPGRDILGKRNVKEVP